MARKKDGVVRDTPVRDLKFRALADELRRGILAGTWVVGQKLPTEQQLAAETGLSLTTVRRAFDEVVAEGLVTRRQGAGSFVAQPTRTLTDRRFRVGVMLPDAQLYYPRVLQGIEEALSASRASLQLATYRYDPAAEDETIDFLMSAGVDGLLLVPTLTGIDNPLERAHQLMDLPVPTVLLERSVLDGGPGDRTEYVCSDHAGGAYDAVRHLAALGHERIALLTRANTPTGPAIEVGYARAIADLGLPAGLTFALAKTQWEAEQAEPARRALAEFEATAALVFGDREATLLEGALRRDGRSVPGDVALVSYDDEVADLAEVPLTAVAPAKYRIGRKAADVLLRRLTEGADCPIHQIRLRPRIVVRESCGAARSIER